MCGLILATLAFAASPVLSGGEPAAAIAAVSRSTGVPQWELRPLGVADLFPGEGALLLGAEQPAQCAAGESNPTEVRELVARGEKLLLRQEWTELRARLREAAALLPCLSAPAEASSLSRLFFLDGFAAGELLDATSASASFRRARAAQPDLPWDDRYPGRARTAFDAVSSAPAANGTLVLGPGYEAVDQLWIDGGLTPVSKGTVSLSEGLHIVQVLQPRVETWIVSVRASRTTALVQAAAARERVLASAGDELGKSVIRAAVDRTLGADAELWVVTGSQLWRVGSTWESRALVPDAAATKPKPAGPLLVGLGAGLALGGAVVAIEAASEAAAHFSAIEDESDQTYTLRNEWYQSASGRTIAGGIAGGVGIATLVAGVLVNAPHAAGVAAVPVEGGGVLVWSRGF
jgi:hypothetical protein